LTFISFLDINLHYIKKIITIMKLLNTLSLTISLFVSLISFNSLADTSFSTTYYGYTYTLYDNGSFEGPENFVNDRGSNELEIGFCPDCNGTYPGGPYFPGILKIESSSTPTFSFSSFNLSNFSETFTVTVKAYDASGNILGSTLLVNDTSDSSGGKLVNFVLPRASYYLISSDVNSLNSVSAWDCVCLIFFDESFLGASGPSAADTQSSMTPNAYALRGTFVGQSAIINTGLNYDCTTFDAKGICVSAGGRVTDTNNPSTNSQGALLIASYRANDQWRIGGYLDQNLSSNDARGVNLDNNNPMGGVFAVWNQNTDGTGYQVRVAAGYSDKDVTISRSAFGLTGEAGKGDSSIQSQAYSATISRGFQLNNARWIASPYLGVRYTKIKRAGYTEDSSTDVTTPLTYSALSQETTTALVGVRFNGQLGDKINLMASAGIENDIAHNTGDYAATGVDGLTPISFNQNIRHIRPVASAGASYAIDKRQTVGANLHYRQEAFNSTNSVTGMVNYQIGF
jgi:uncharacterized protein YhjY with autotransporter beta-barrel domain